MRRRRFRVPAAVAMVATLVLAMSGSVSVVATHGVSMLPTYHTGDLVVVREAAPYGVGDKVAYVDEGTGVTVLHRIIDGDAQSGFVLKGDSNDSIDPETPTGDEILGEAWIHIPQGGTWIQRLTGPAGMAASAFVVLAGGGSAAAVHTRRKHRRRKGRAVADQDHPGVLDLPGLAAVPPALQPLAAGTALFGVLGVALTALAWSSPTERLVPASTSVESTMDFSYTATVPTSAAYDGTTVSSPQPVFRALTDSVDVGYRYTGPAGTLTVSAEMSASSGWSTTVPLDGPSPLGGAHEGRVTLDLDALQARADAAAAVTGLPTGSLAVAVVPTVTLDGGGEFAPRLQLTLDQAALRPDGEFTSRDSRAVSGTRLEGATLSALGASVRVRTARHAGAAALIVTLLLAVGLVLVNRHVRPLAETERTRRAFGSMILSVLPVALPSDRPVVDVPDVASLVRLAERYGLLVLTWERGGVHTYVVQDESATFRYRTGEEVEEPPTAGSSGRTAGVR